MTLCRLRRNPLDSPAANALLSARSTIDLGCPLQFNTPTLPKPVPLSLFARQKISSIVFDVELVYLARRRGYRLAIVPIRWYDKRGSRMSARPGLAIRVAWDLLRMPFLHRASSRRRG